MTLATRTTSGISRRTPGSAPVTAAGEEEWEALIGAGGSADLIPTRRIHYRDGFLRSDVWKKVRGERLKADNQCCQGCGFRSTHNDAHHIFYPLDWNATRAEDLRTLCRDCHNIVEALTHSSTVHSRAEGLRRWKIAKGKIASFREWRARLLRPSVK